MTDLILSTRVAVLQRNLNQVGDVLNAVEERRASLRELLSAQDAAGELLDLLSVHVGAAQRGVYQGDGDAVLTELHGLDGIINRLRHQLQQAQPGMASIRSRSLDLTRGDLKDSLRELLDQGLGASTLAMGSVERKLREAAATAGAGEHAAARDQLHDAWEAYRTDLLRETQTVFAEYLDLLGGLAMRDAGVDSGICAIADELIRGCGSFSEYKWNSLTVPARREAFDMTLARIIRIGFPEWTIWALPLTAHELGHVVARRYEPLRLAADVVADEHRNEFRMLQADGFATYVMGPAYACAAILMRLDPWDAFDPGDRCITARRVHMILTMLRRMSSGVDDPLYGITVLLEQEWNAALEQVGSLAALTKPQEEAIETLADQLIAGIGLHRGLPIEDWTRIEEWSQLLLTDRAAEISRRTEDLDPLRYLLNAAWHARLELRGLEPKKQLQRIAAVADAAQVAWEGLNRGDQADDHGATPLRLTPPTAPATQFISRPPAAASNG